MFIAYSLPDPMTSIYLMKCEACSHFLFPFMYFFLNILTRRPCTVTKAEVPEFSRGKCCLWYISQFYNAINDTQMAEWWIFLCVWVRIQIHAAQGFHPSVPVPTVVNASALQIISSQISSPHPKRIQRADDFPPFRKEEKEWSSFPRKLLWKNIESGILFYAK